MCTGDEGKYQRCCDEFHHRLLGRQRMGNPPYSVDQQQEADPTGNHPEQAHLSRPQVAGPNVAPTASPEAPLADDEAAPWLNERSNLVQRFSGFRDLPRRDSRPTVENTLLPTAPTIDPTNLP